MNSARYPSVAQLFPVQHRAAAAVLGRAFVNDPLIGAIIGAVDDVAERARRMSLLFGVILAEQTHAGQPVLGVLDQGRVGAAAIIEQVPWPSSSAATVLRGLLLLPDLVRAAGLSGLMRAVTTLDTLLKHRPAEPHIYLNVLGVEPDLQRRHYGVALLDYLRAQAAMRPDLAGVYLETATAANVAYYSRVGYEVIGEIRPLGVRVWRMLQRRTI